MIKSKILSSISKIIQFSEKKPFVFPLVLLAFALITYGVFIFSLGFYWDDWPPILLSHIPDPKIVWEYWSHDRPFQSWTYYLLFPLCNDSPALWQLSAIIARWTAALTLYLTFLRIFPRQKTLLQWSAVLFVVFPGFSDQYASVSYGSHFMIYTVFGLSMYFMVLAVQNKSKFWVFYPLSLILTAAHLFSMEYFVGLEFIRPLLLFIMLNESEKKKLKSLLRTVILWLPYIAVLAFYIYWRMVIYPNSVVDYSGSNYPFLIKNLIETPGDTLITFLQTVYSDLRFLFLDIWTDRILPLAIEIKSITYWLSLFIGIGAAFVLHFFLSADRQENVLQLKAREVWRNIILSMSIILLGIFPIWSTLRQITKGKWSDRFDIPAIFGVAILLLTLFFIIIQTPKIRNTILILVVGLSISYQIQIGNDYRKDFIRQKVFYTNLAWRIPSLQPGTTLYAPGMPSDKEADYSYSMGINLLYTTTEMDTSFDYWFSGPRYYSPETLLADPNLEIKDGLRNYQFIGSASEMVSIHMTGGCLWVIDPYYALIPEGISLLPAYAELTNQDLIGETPAETNQLSKIIDTSPQNTWCYYFEKGDLAQSKGKMEEAVNYYEQAISEGLVPLEAIEYLPFVKAYAKLGRIEEAVALTELSFKRTGYAKPSICQVWQDVVKENPAISLSDIKTVYNSKNCSNLVP